MRVRLLAITLAAFVGSLALPASTQVQVITVRSAKGQSTSTTFPTAGGRSSGGSDDCSAPDPIYGTGSFVFDNSSATTGSEGQNEPKCDLGAGQPI